MTHPDLISYITEQTQDGISADVLRQTLMESGWRQADIDNALHDVAAGLHPATPGASIHADLAQVRGMVAHLATRIGGLETKLTNAGVLPMQAELPSGTIGAERELSPAPESSVARHIIVGLIAIVTSIGIWKYTANLLAQHALAPTDGYIIAGALGAVLLIGGMIAVRTRSAWVASMLIDIAIGVWIVAAWLAYHSYHAMEWSTALGLGVLLCVILVVMERWVDRSVR